MTETRDAQPALVEETPPPGPRAADPRFAGAAEHLPIARVAADVSLAHLDRPFDYLVPADLADDAVPGCRVTVRFAGKQVGGFVLERAATTEHVGRLGRLGRVLSPEVVLRPDVVRLCREVADRYAGVFADVVRLAVPPRHARTEKRAPREVAIEPRGPAQDDAWAVYEGGSDFVHALADGSGPRAVWNAVPSDPPERALAQAVDAVLRSGRGAVVCLPDVSDVVRADAVFTEVLGPGRHVVLTADLGPSARYAAFLALARGQVRAVVGTRAAAFAPVHDLGLVAVWDDGDDLLAEPRAPYPHAREVLLTRAWDTGCGVLVGGYARTAEAQQLVASGWCRSLTAPMRERRVHWARITIDAGAGALQAARIPGAAFAAVRSGLAVGPVLVQVPRVGYRAALACQDCRTPARCGRCSGPLGQDRPGDAPRCRWCGEAAADWSCPTCGGRRLRAPVSGERRTAEELGRAFPGVRVRSSAGDAVLREVPDEPAIVVATPGAEPRAERGYAAALLLDTAASLSRPDLRTHEESLRRWLNASALVRSSTDGGQVVAVGDPGLPVLQALVRADPVGHAERELVARIETRLPPAARLAAVEGELPALRELAGGPWPEHAQVLGPVELRPAGEDEDHPWGRLIVAVPRTEGAALARRLQVAQSERAVHKARPYRIAIDPQALG
ncbi:primosomal protein N' [Mumia sp. zg.B17]|uniref:primosomal protein N' n=1 Tax=Mumia sp. zg.B17 TaxID=2855446 RepID=UPI0027E23DAF|nr:primosomal protein N' [Mumia sp. zg.B17]